MMSAADSAHLSIKFLTINTMSVHNSPPNRIFKSPKPWQIITLLVLAGIGLAQVIRYFLLILDFVWSILNNVYG